MSKSEDRALLAVICNGHTIKQIPEGTSAIVRGPDRDPLRRGDVYRETRITVVTDHCGREHYKNEEGEWL